jgi:hypothetical protein
MKPDDSLTQSAFEAPPPSSGTKSQKLTLDQIVYTEWDDELMEIFNVREAADAY